MAKFASLPLFTDAWIADTSHLTRAERGLYLDLLVLMWRSPDCRVPNDLAWIARKLRCEEAEMATLAEIVREFCQSTGNWIFQKRLRKEFEHVGAAVERQRRRASSRWDRDTVSSKPLGRQETSDAAALQRLNPSGNAPTPTPTPTYDSETPPRVSESITNIESQPNTSSTAPSGPSDPAFDGHKPDASRRAENLPIAVGDGALGASTCPAPRSGPGGPLQAQETASSYPTAKRLPMIGRNRQYPQAFEAIWAAYPTRGDDTKDLCYEHWRRLVTSGAADEASLLGQAHEWHREQGTNPYRIGMRRWLSKGDWQRAPPRQRANGQGGNADAWVAGIRDLDAIFSEHGAHDDGGAWEGEADQRRIEPPSDRAG